ncbi:MAG: sodium:calcium antiporter [Candidatus Melainabacteria bacterium]|nr:sodium:calcium antiporter [Candidatus Melainabacteria bacterium]
MTLAIVVLIISLVVIVAAAELFTNGIEWLGQRLELSEGVVGSVLAAVGTALPETLIPIVAVLCFGQREGDDVGIGAITGAPFMLSTLTLGLCGIAGMLFLRSGKRTKELTYNTVVMTRDLKFFILAYAIALGTAALTFHPVARYFMAGLILMIYPVYLYFTFQSSGDVGEEPEKLYLDRVLKKGSNKLRYILPQVMLGLLGIVGGAYFFVDYIQDIAEYLGFPALVLSLVVCPIATELPEKVNSILWIRQGKDTLAMGNVTGAMVFQSCIPVAFGVAFTPWNLDSGVVMTGVVAIFSASVLLLLIKLKKLSFPFLAAGAVLYVGAVTLLLNLDTAPGHGVKSHPSAEHAAPAAAPVVPAP